MIGEHNVYTHGEAYGTGGTKETGREEREREGVVAVCARAHA